MAITKQQIKKRLKKFKYKPIELDSRSIYLSIKYKNRPDELKKIVALFMLNDAKLSNKRTYSSDGHVIIGNINVVITPNKLSNVDQRRMARHLSVVPQKSLKNEIYLEKAISQIIWDTMTPLTVIFIASGKRSIIKNVVGSSRVGGDTADRKKADILIKTKSISVPVSIKMDTASFWESADSYWGKNARTMLEVAAVNDKLEADIDGKSMRMKKPVGSQANRKEEKDVVFGSDIARNGIIVKKTFDHKDFIYNGDNHTLIVKCTRLYVNQTDLKPNDKAWFVVRNNRNARSRNIGINGVVVDAVPKKSVSSTTNIIRRGLI